MTPVELSNEIYHDEDAARAHIEAFVGHRVPRQPFLGDRAVALLAALIASSFSGSLGYWPRVLLVAALGVIGTVMLQRWKRDLALRTPAQQGLDIGQMVQVQSWGPEGTARVAYRGSTWDAELSATGVPQAKTMYIAAMRGSVLILSDRRPDAPQQP